MATRRMPLDSVRRSSPGPAGTEPAWLPRLTWVHPLGATQAPVRWRRRTPPRQTGRRAAAARPAIHDMGEHGRPPPPSRPPDVRAATVARVGAAVRAARAEVDRQRQRPRLVVEARRERPHQRGGLGAIRRLQLGVLAMT